MNGIFYGDLLFLGVTALVILALAAVIFLLFKLRR